MKRALVFLQILAGVSVLLWIIIIQGNTISAQRRVIKEMAQNPSCLIP
jgi:hypothetical protein